MRQPVPSPVLREHVLGFVSAFVAKHRRGRWKALLLEGQQTPQDAASDSTWLEQRSGPWSGSLVASLEEPGFAERRRDPVVVVPLRAAPEHEQPQTDTLEAALLQGEWIEGLDSLLPGTLAVVLDHEGGVRVCRRGKP